MSHRPRILSALLSGVLLAGVMVLWGRSFIVNDTLFLPLGQRVFAIDSIRGEVSLWVGRTIGDPGGPWLDRVDAERGVTAVEYLSLERSDEQRLALGFGYAIVGEFPGRVVMPAGPIILLLAPYWFLAVLAAALPVRLLLAGTRRKPRPVVGRCRHCGSDWFEGDTACRVCGGER